MPSRRPTSCRTDLVYSCDPTVLWLNVISDSLIGFSFYCIPVVLIYFIRRNRIR